ncbi:tyrosine-type recombinase/integrase [Lachnospiraceae bacterium MD1]|jgi:integrase/recombinase XerD|uniref:Tyrosine-type recombinase/integrase n=1 Tax=Variimorphobacter saccharofermentans TaxID=2755051 RepID=A0A839K079_9FIRM|nr:tyrosine-type recombinase/integrase [Variimorphobacter saccharofermentans]MBB2183060.1 tyrosine-type recombinase/integrase [Variimorphobacter saccharofermentans]
MEQYVMDFIAYLQNVKHASKNTLQAYKNDLKKLMAFLDKQSVFSVGKITETNLNSYILSLEKEGLSPSSVSRNIASIKSFLLYLVKHGIMTGDPSERIKAPKVSKKTPQIIDNDLMERLLQQPNVNTPKGIRDRAILELLYATGIKVSELIMLKLTDINMTGRYITCREFKERNIPFGKSAESAIKQYLKIRQECFNKYDLDYLFLNISGEQLSRQGLWKILKGYAAMVGMKNISPNAIRHTFAAHMIRNGADLGSVQEFLGHADITTTQLYLTNPANNSREVYMNTHPRA